LYDSASVEASSAASLTVIDDGATRESSVRFAEDAAGAAEPPPVSILGSVSWRSAVLVAATQRWDRRPPDGKVLLTSGRWWS